VVSVEDLDDRVRLLKSREAEAQRKRAQFASQRAVREDRLAQLEKQLCEQFGASSDEEAIAKLAELRGEFEGQLRAAESALGEVVSG